MERAPDPFGEKIFPRPPVVLAGDVNGRDGKDHRIREIPQSVGSMREHLAPQARTLGRDHAAPDAMLANVPVPRRERQALAAHPAVSADGDRSGSLLPGLLRPRLTGNHTSASRLLSVHRACRMTRAHARLPTRAGAGTSGGHTATWAGACAVAREWFGWAAGKPVICPLLSRFFRISLSRAVSSQHCHYRLSLPQLA